MALALAAIAARVVYIQGPESGRYLAVGSNEWTHAVTLAGARGAIVDSQGAELAMSIPQTSIYADPHQVTDPRGEAAVLAPLLGQPVSAVQARLTANAGFVYLARTVDDATAAGVKAARLSGIFSLAEPKRFYPAGQLASPLIGAVGTDGVGLGGLESHYNSVLQGRPGKLIEQTDPQGRQLPGGLQEYQAPVAGQDLVLTIDQSLQYATEAALSQAIVAARAKSGIALLMDTKTGNILASANLTTPGPGVPSTTPAVPSTASSATTAAGSSAPVESPSASAFTQVYEPGSVNKLITISAALQTGTVVPSDTLTIPDSYPVAGTNFSDAERHGTKQWNVTDILANSSNIGTVKIAQQLGKANLLHYVAAFGEGQRTDIGFPGESRGLLPSYWSGTSIADVPIGQGIGVTAVQMLAAYNTVANGGVYVAPRLVDGMIGGDGIERKVPATPGHRVVSPTVAAQMTTMLDEVVRVGTGQAASLSPYTVAGKTGTALVPGRGGYQAGHYVASFAGFVPAEAPSITAMVVIDDTVFYGAAASAPTFAAIARAALQQRAVVPQAPRPPAPGVPLASSATATAADPTGVPLPGLPMPGGPATPAPPTSTTAPPATAPTTAGTRTRTGTAGTTGTGTTGTTGTTVAQAG